MFRSHFGLVRYNFGGDHCFKEHLLENLGLRCEPFPYVQYDVVRAGKCYLLVPF